MAKNKKSFFSFRLATLDRGLLLATLFLMSLGVVQVYSSSFIFATERFSDGHFFVLKQAAFALLSVMVLLVCSQLPWRLCRLLGVFLFFLSIVGLGLTFVDSLGVEVGGAQRWIRLPMGIRFEPAELFKVTLPFALALVVVKLKSHFFSIIGCLLFFSLPAILLLRQPDFGTLVISLMLGLCLLFAFGLKWRYVLGAVTFAVPVLIYLVVSKEYRLQRVQAFLDPWSDPSDKGFQIIQSMLSFHSGGLTGQGLGQGQGKLFFLPEAHTDFTLAVLGEEWGFIGVLIVLSLFAFMVLRGFQISLHEKNAEDKAIALGLVLVFAFSVLINSGVVLGLLPTKGLTLPFLSYGGSSLLCTSAAIGWLLNIDHRQRAFHK